MNFKDLSLKAYRPETQLIEMSPGFRSRRLSEIELGRLVLLGNARDGTAGAAIGIRADALSRTGDVTEGVVRLGARHIRFERHDLDQTVMAVEVEYLLEPYLAGAAVRPVAAGDLIVSPTNGAVGVLVAGPWQGLGLLEVASALARPFTDTGTRGPPVCLAWQLVDREERRRILFTRGSSEHPSEPAGDAPTRYAGARADEDD